MKPGRTPVLSAFAGVAALAAAGCLGTGTRRVDAPCREMRGSVARELLRDAREIPVLDVRSTRPRELKGAVAIPLEELAGRVEELNRYRGTTIVVVGDDGPTGQKACETLAAAGFRYVVFVTEGAAGLFAGVRGGLDGGEASRDRP